jgi:Ribbon-helix-helix protein, copG family
MQRERLTITLDTELLQAVDATIDRSAIRNRSHAIEHAIREGLALSELSTAVLSLTVEGSSKIPEILSLLGSIPVSSYIVIAAPGGLDAAQMVARQLGVSASIIPGDFGTGAALLLSKQSLTHPFLYIHLSARLRLPKTIVPAYIHHRRNRLPVTRLLSADAAGTLLETGISIIEPDIIARIPAGLASLEEQIFPDLAKAGTVGAYVTEPA